MLCFKLPFFCFLSSLFLHVSLAEIICEDLPYDVCAFSISSSGKRCLLETAMERDDEVECRTSNVVVERMAGYIESDKCVRACGVDRNSIGISSDSLLEPKFTNKLCAPACSHNCPNIVDLFFNLAAGEGVFLPNLCASRRINPRRSMASKSKATPYTIFVESPPSPIFSKDSDLASSSEKVLGSGEESDLGPSSAAEAVGPTSDDERDLESSPEEAPGPISDDERDLEPSPEEAPSPSYGEASAPTPAPAPTPMGAFVSIPTPSSSPISALVPAPLGFPALASVPTPAPIEDLVSDSFSAPETPSFGALVSDLSPTPTLMG